MAVGVLNGRIVVKPRIAGHRLTIHAVFLATSIGGVWDVFFMYAIVFLCQPEHRRPSDFPFELSFSVHMHLSAIVGGQTK